MHRNLIRAIALLVIVIGVLLPNSQRLLAVTRFSWASTQGLVGKVCRDGAEVGMAQPSAVPGDREFDTPNGYFLGALTGGPVISAMKTITQSFHDTPWYGFEDDEIPAPGTLAYAYDFMLWNDLLAVDASVIITGSKDPIDGFGYEPSEELLVENCLLYATVGGTVSGLAGSGLVLALNGGDTLPIVSDGAFTFPTYEVGDGFYAVDVDSQPSNPAQTCTVTKGMGEILGDNVTDVAVICATNQYSLPVNIIGNGTVAHQPDQELYLWGTVVTLTATPDFGSSFIGWSGAITSSNNPITLTVDTTKIVTATFDPLPVGVILTQTVGLNPATCALPGDITVSVGTTVYYCYTIHNTGVLTLTNHTLATNLHGPIFTDLPYTFAPDQTINTVELGQSISQTISITTTPVATWTASVGALTPVQSVSTPTTVGIESIGLLGTRNYLPALSHKYGTWIHQNLSQITDNVPVPTGDPSGYVTPGTDSHHLYYRGIDNQIYELFLLNGAWTNNNLSQLAGGAPAAAGNPTSYVPAGTIAHRVYYRGTDNQIHGLFQDNGTWTHHNISQLASNAPAAASDPSGYVTPGTDSHHLYYRGIDNQIYELFLLNGAWTNHNLSQLAGNAPAAVGNPTSYVPAGTIAHHVYYRGTDNQIHGLFQDNGTWTHHNISQLAGNAPAAASDPSGYVTPGTDSHHLYYRGIDNQIYELFLLNGAWTNNNLSQLAGNAPAAAGNPTSYVPAGTIAHHVYYRGTDNQIHGLFQVNGTWTHYTISQLAGNAPAAAGNPTSYVATNPSSHYVYYRGIDNEIHKLFLVDHP